MKNKYLCIACMLILVFAISCSENRVEFRPVYFNGDLMPESDSSYGTDFYLNVQKVLRHYREDFILHDGKILISNSLFEDKELIYNYTQKASDSTWLEGVENGGSD